MPSRSFEQIEHDLKTGRRLHLGGRLRDAEQVCRAALGAGHMSPLLALSMAEILKDTGRAAEALPWYERALELSPGDAGLYAEFAALLSALGREDEALAVLARGREAAPALPSLLADRARRLVADGRVAEGAAILRQAVALAPRQAGLRNDLGCVLLRLGAQDEAAAQFREGLAADPNHAPLLNNHAGLCRMRGRPEEAERYYRQAVAADPGHADAWGNLGGLLRESGRMAEAREALRRALALRGPWPERHSNLIFCLDFDPDAGLREQAEERARWRRAIEAPLAGRRYRHGVPADPEKRLRIGYVSADFVEHSAALMFGAVLLNHDLGRHDVILYSASGREDERSREFIGHATGFRRVGGLGDAELARLINNDGIDILVDLSGHTPHNRLPAFALRPAPVQATAWGYATGTGLEAIDYFLADHRLVPERLRQYFTERIVELPCFLSYRPRDAMPEPGPPPAARAGRVTFGSLNRLAKASPACLRAWAGLLHAVPGSRLLLKCSSLDETRTRAGILELFAAEGIAADRLELRGRSPHRTHLETYREIDIALDPFPYCGGTTTCEALWMGLPVISLCGEVPVSRNGHALLGAIGFEEWVARGPDEYLAKAAALAAAPQRLAALRTLLPRIVRASPLGDNAGYTRAVENAYRRMWLRHCLSVQVLTP